MVGEVVKLNVANTLAVIVKMENYENAGSLAYDRKYWFLDYNPELDDLEVNLDDVYLQQVKGLRLPFEVQKHIKPYTVYGKSEIRGIKKVYLERSFDEPNLPTR